MRAVTGKPIKLLGTGERWDALEDFHPQRIAGRILGMGDVVSLVEKAAQTIDAEKAQQIAQKMRKGEFDLEDLADQLKQMQKLGGMGGVMGMLPGVGKIKQQMAGANLDDSVLKRQTRHHLVDDAAGAAPSQGSRCQAQAAHRGRLRHQGRGHQQAAEDAPPDGGHDEDDGQEQRHDAAHGGRHGAWAPVAARRARRSSRRCRRSSRVSIRRRWSSCPRKCGKACRKGGGLPGFGSPAPRLPGLPGLGGGAPRFPMQGFPGKKK